MTQEEIDQAIAEAWKAGYIAGGIDALKNQASG